MVTRLSPVLAACLLSFGLVHAQASVDPADFAKKVEISFAGYTRSTTLTNFPALVQLNAAIDGFSYDQFTSPSGSDLRFVLGNSGTELPFEIDAWNSNGDSFVWVRVPALSGTNTVITAYWGSTNTTLPAYATNGTVWAQDYTTVWHLEGGGRRGPYADSSPAGNTGIVSGRLDERAGVIGSAKFLGNGESVQTVRDAPITGAAPRTVSVWLNSNNTTGHIFSLGTNGYSYSAFGLCAVGRQFQVWWGDQNATTTDQPVTADTWHHAALSFDGATAALYVNGAQVVAGPVAVNTALEKVILGSPTWQDYAGTYEFQADEFRVADVARSPDWIWASWRNQSAPTAFATYGSVKRARDTLPDVVSEPASNITFDSAVLNGTLVSTGAAPTEVVLFWGETDAGQTAAGWDATNVLGTVTSTPPLVLSTRVTGLTPETGYAYRFYATNAYGGAWSPTAAGFTTLSARPRIQNQAATHLAITSATLRGSLTYTGAAPAVVTVFWGEEDGGTSLANWQNAEALGTNSLPVPAAVTRGITGLAPKRTYYYRFYATNAFGDGWAPSSATFATSDEVDHVLIPAGSTWQYLDDGSDQGTNWVQIGFDAGSWSNGPAELGYGDSIPEATVISYGNDPENRHITYYFRREIELSAADAAAASRGEVRLQRDDGAVVYLNGTEIFRSNMPTGTIDYLTFAGFQTVSEVEYFPQAFDPGLLRGGTNVVAVEVHQQSRTSTDVSFDLEMDVTFVYPSVGFGPTPSVADFTLDASHTALVSSAPNDHSGCALREKSNEVIVPNRSFALRIATMQVYGMDGIHHRMITLPGWDDVEGVRLIDPVNDTYAILEEGNGDITLVTIDDQVTNILKSSGITYATGIDGQDNKGLEGVAYDAARDCFYVVKEKFPLSVFRVGGPPTNTTTTPLFDAEAVFAGLATDLSDITYDPVQDHLLILSDEAATVFECTLDGTIVSMLPVAGNQPEGVALSADGLELHIMSEPADYFRYRREQRLSRSLEGTNLSVRVGLTSPWTNAVSVDYTVNSGTAIFGQDITNSSGIATGTIVIAPGATEAFIPLGIVADGIVEPPERFTVTLSNAVSAVLTTDREFLHVIEPERTYLTVESPFGSPVPSRGRNHVLLGGIYDCAMTGSPIGNATTQTLCVGWTGTGSVPSSGSGTGAGPLTVTNDSTITWLWATNYWLEATAYGAGSVDGGNAWYRRGTNIVLTATALPYVTFAGWSGDTGRSDTNDPNLSLVMDGALAVTAHFDEEMATNATPIWWLVKHYGDIGNFDELAMSDTDDDGLRAWQEYRAGTIPTNPLSRLAIVGLTILVDRNTTIHWDSAVEHVYNVYATTNLLDPEWVPVHQLQGTGGPVSYTSTNGSPRRTYYRVSVQPE